MDEDDIFRCDFFFLIDNREASVSVHFRLHEDFAGTPLEVTQAIAEQAETSFWAGFWQNHASNELTFARTRCQKVYPTRDVIYESFEHAGELGEDEASALVAMDAVLISEYTNFWGPRTRGRIYLPGLAENAVEQGRIINANLIAIQAAADVFFVTTITVTGDHGGDMSTVVFSPAKPTAVPPLDATWGGPIRPVVRPRIATQRRRRTTVLTAFPDSP